MPELPEVEHARQRFLAMCEGATIHDARASDDIVVTGQSLVAWSNALIGRRVEGADRIGKNVVVSMSGDRALWFHLGMTGRLVRAGAEDEAVDAETGLPRFTRWWVETSEGIRVCMTDGRRLGRTHAGVDPDVRRVAKLDALGPDALSVEDGAALAERFRKVRGPIKPALMDQARIAGIGNIQAAEALWLSRIHPETPVPELTPEHWSRLVGAMAESLRQSLDAMNGEEEIVYVEAGGPNPFIVYGREGEPCPRCRSKIVREVSRGRSSYLCPRCQRLRKLRA